VRDLEGETGIAVGYAAEGTLLVALDRLEIPPHEAHAAFLRGAGLPAQVLSPAEAARREPALARDLAGALWIGEARLDNRRLWEAYAASCAKRGVSMRVGEPVLGIVAKGGAVSGVRVSAGEVAADAVVIAAGAWSEALGEMAGVRLRTVPVRGQMQRLACPEGAIRHAVKHGLHYAVPHRGAGAVVGTTSEEAGFDKTTHEAVLDRLVEKVGRFLPALPTWPRVETWSGFRPRLPDHLPAIGAVRGRPGLFVATGHYRNGILLCAETGDLVASAVLGAGGGSVDSRASCFSPDRPALLE
jgi:glycine oxidase